jgi:site-specific recombinase XerD
MCSSTATDLYNSNVNKLRGAIAIMSTIKVSVEIQREIDRYKQFMLEHEYTTHTARGYSTYISRFLRQPKMAETDSLQEQITSFIESQRKCNPKNLKSSRAAIRLYYKMITGENFPKRLPKEPNPEIDIITRQFYDYSINIKRIQPSTALSDVSWIQKFLGNSPDCKLSQLESITAHEIRDFVINCLAHLSDTTKGDAVTAIRNFFRFLKFEGIPVHESIFLLPLSPAVWKNAAFPTTINENVFKNLHEVPNDSTPTGKRDRCIILCFTELALRCIEVASLTVDDFNWREGYVSIKNTKTHADRNLPVSEKLGQAVVEYLQNARPKTNSRILFVRFKHICGEPMGCSQIRGVVRRVYAKYDTDIKSTGTHILRRTAGTQLYNSGNSLKLTADILGHESLDSTVRYAKADITGLQQVAAPWPVVPGKAGVHGAE